MAPDCIFCKIVAGEIPSAKVFENDDVLVFLDINPINPGHTLVIPKKHYETLDEAPPEVMAKVGAILPQVAAGVQKATGAEGYNLFQANGQVAGQVVPHLHIHIVPRLSTDDFSFGWRQGEYAEGGLDQMRDAIVDALAE